MIVEINLAQPLALEGLHDIWIPEPPPEARAASDRAHAMTAIGTPAIEIPPDKIAAIVITNSRTARPPCCPPMKRPR